MVVSIHKKKRKGKRREGGGGRGQQREAAGRVGDAIANRLYLYLSLCPSSKQYKRIAKESDRESKTEMRRSASLLTATPERFHILGTTHPKPKRGGLGRNNKMRSKPSDNVAWYDKGPVEWLPRPVRLTYEHLDQLRDWMMRETLSGSTTEFNRIRELHREWSQHPLMPVLGDVEPKFPLNLFKQNHRAKHRFLVRWHQANTPANWLWMPRGPATAPTADEPASLPLHRSSPAQFPENWKQLMRRGNAQQTAASPAAALASGNRGPGEPAVGSGSGAT